MRKTTALIAGLALLGGLTACSGATTTTETGAVSCAPTVTSSAVSELSPGRASAAVSATGDLGTAPKVDLPTPLFSKTTNVNTLIAGSGPTVTAGQPVILDATILNGADGLLLQKTNYRGGGVNIITAGPSNIPALSQGLTCAKVGSRIAIVGSPEDSHSGAADPQNGIGEKDSFVYVVDVKEAFLAKANGADQLPSNGMPAIVLLPDGTPGISMPSGSAPKRDSVSVLKKGAGETVKSGQFVVVKFTAVGWRNKLVFDSSWANHQATILRIGTPSVSPGLNSALIGKSVGSQILAVLTPGSALVPDGSGKAPINDSAVYVLDILGITG